MQIEFLTRKKETMAYQINKAKKKSKKYFANRNEKNIAGSKTFWQTIKSFLSGITKSREKNTLIENKKMVPDNVEAANCFDNLFSNIVEHTKLVMNFI